MAGYAPVKHRLQSQSDLKLVIGIDMRTHLQYIFFYTLQSRNFNSPSGPQLPLEVCIARRFGISVSIYRAFLAWLIHFTFFPEGTDKGIPLWPSTVNSRLEDASLLRTGELNSRRMRTSSHDYLLYGLSFILAPNRGLKVSRYSESWLHLITRCDIILGSSHEKTIFLKSQYCKNVALDFLWPLQSRSF